MGIVNSKYKHVFVGICLFGIFLCGYNFNRWYTKHNRVKKHISVIYSFTESDASYGNFDELLEKELREQGIEPILDKFYLCSDTNDLTEETERIQRYLKIVKSKPLDLILTIGDQSISSLISTQYPLLDSLPIVACNVHFPDEQLISEYQSKQVYVLRDIPDFRSNIDFIKVLQAHANMEVLYNIDFTFYGHKSFDLLTKIVDRENVRILSSESSFPIEYEYNELKGMVEYYSLMPAVAKEDLKKNKLTVSLCPFRYMKGSSLLIMMEKSKSEQGRKAFLLDKFDSMAHPIVNSLSIPSFSCLREGFGGRTKIVGGYMATDVISARTVANVSANLLKNKKADIPKMQDLKKEYVLDWTYLSIYSGYDMKNVPSNVRIINYPFYDHYKLEIYLLGGLFVLAFIYLSVILLRTRRRSLVQHKNMKMLEEAHKRLTLSTDGGQISLWNIQDEVVEFDENYSTLTGLGQQRFTKDEFLRYVHPDDLERFSDFCETLYTISDMHVERSRFSFGDEEYQWYEFRCRNLENTQGGMMMAGIMQNIQEVVEREQQLILAKQMAEKAELKQSFLNNMSHEIRTPLNAIVGFTNLLIGEESDEIEPEEKEEMLRIINLNNDLLLKLVDDVVVISHLDSGSMEFDIKECNLTEVVREIYKTYLPLIKPSLQFHLELDETVILPIDIDCLRFIQVVSNFLNNANKFTWSGHITLGCNVNKELNEASVYVEDTGKGINEQELMMIFDRFYKTDEFEQGSGLGLSISKVIVERLSGRIEVQSKADSGSRFTVILPLK